MEYFTSDLHFGHKSILSYDKRPFSTAKEMDEELIKRWNNKISKKDTVYILGDISWYKKEQTKEILQRLNGKKVLIKGNHDSLKDIEYYKDLFVEVVSYKEIKINRTKIILCHFPIMFYNGQHNNSIMLYGHVHNSKEENLLKLFKKDIRILEPENKCRMYNVGCMLWDYEPVSLKEILDREENNNV